MAAQKPNKSFQVQLSSSQLTGFLLLTGLSLIISFYLGFVSGNSLRSPVQNITPQKIVEETGPLSNSVSPEELDFFKSLDSESTVNASAKTETFNTQQLENLKNKTDQLAKQQAKKAEQTQKEVKKTTPAPPPTVKVKQTVKTTSTVAPTTTVKKVTPPQPQLVESKVVGNYTIQVFVSGNKKRAENLVQQLKEDGHLAAYLQTTKNSENRTLYRVRVGKTAKKSAESLAKKLLKLSYVDQAQLTRL